MFFIEKSLEKYKNFVIVMIKYYPIIGHQKLHSELGSTIIKGIFFSDGSIYYQFAAF